MRIKRTSGYYPVKRYSMAKVVGSVLGGIFALTTVVAGAFVVRHVGPQLSASIVKPAESQPIVATPAPEAVPTAKAEPAPKPLNSAHRAKTHGSSHAHAAPTATAQPVVAHSKATQILARRENRKARATRNAVDKLLGL